MLAGVLFTYANLVVFTPVALVCHVPSVLPSIQKACQPYKTSVLIILWCGNGRSPNALMWPQAPSRLHPPIMC